MKEFVKGACEGNSLNLSFASSHPYSSAASSSIPRVVSPPVAKNFENWDQVLAEVCDPVLHMRRNLWIDGSQNDSVLLKAAQLPGSASWYCSRKGLLQLREAQHSSPIAREYERLPLSADHFEPSLNQEWQVGIWATATSAQRYRLRTPSASKNHFSNGFVIKELLVKCEIG